MLWQNIWSIRKRLPHPRKYRLPIEENIEEPFTRNDYRKQAIYRNGFHKLTQYDRRMALKTFGCVIGNGWCFISWNSKGITNKVPPSWSPSAEKLEKKSLFSAFCWNKTTICHDRAFPKGCVQFYGWWFFQWKSIDKSSFHVWWCGPLSFFVHYMKSSFEELLRDLQIISKELFLSSWNLVSTTNLNTAYRKRLMLFSLKFQRIKR